MCILFAYTLLDVVSHYDLSVVCMSGMGFQPKKCSGRWGELYTYFWNLFNFAKPRIFADFHW